MFQKFMTKIKVTVIRDTITSKNGGIAFICAGRSITLASFVTL